ncbi:aminoglycoside N(3)-acetyltransferase [Nocardiopsis flavescens]|uniref:Aminoglycoside N(3)-acetyltransferase n=1 Tax=Nocardiopsis flavescens TaxID=758803 RepID=A0A1M6Q704_9ACTN|nr:AAC(3) family N-acetyltransferase [Nocardiopsis flavescens]SHK16084.1 aminoglycoside 3-N-acetyltransferase [Nocardiopsis flavescens]
MTTAPDPAQDAPRTRRSLAADLAALGLRRGDTVLVHSSLSALGWVCGGAQAAVQALQDALGPSGTLVVPAQTMDNSEPSAWRDPPVPAAWWPTIRDHTPGFDPLTTPGARMGRIAEAVRTLPGAVRSPHPQTSFAAAGPRARALMEPHPLTCRLGEDSPLGRLADARVLLLGTGYDTCTAFHLAEYRVPDPRTEPVGCAVSAPGGARAWATFTDTALDSGDFAALGEAFEATGAVTTGTVGSAAARLFTVGGAVDFATAWLTAHRS